jgi:hypothetical protein
MSMTTAWDGAAGFAIEEDLSGEWLVEVHHEVGDGGFAAAAGADEGDALAG